MEPHTCNRRLFLIGTATTFAGALLAACAPPKQTIDAKDVPVGSAVIVGNFIITQPTSGVYHAYSATCPHQGAKISQVNGDTVTCTNHNSVFSITDGAPVSGPSRAGLKEAKLKTDGNNKLTPELYPKTSDVSRETSRRHGPAS